MPDTAHKGHRLHITKYWSRRGLPGSQSHGNGNLLHYVSHEIGGVPRLPTLLVFLQDFWATGLNEAGTVLRSQIAIALAEDFYK